MTFNGTELMANPVEYLLSIFIDLLGTGFYLVPVSIIAGALFVQKRDPVMVSMFMITAGGLLSSGGLFYGYSEMALAYIIFAGIGLATLFIQLYFNR